MARSGLRRLTWISIHAPREGCDKDPPVDVVETLTISIHAPREGCDRALLPVCATPNQFQSTHPARGATISISATSANKKFQSTHPARGATLCILELAGIDDISIHAPREGCDGGSGIDPDSAIVFQSTHPARGATGRPIVDWKAAVHFNPRTPRGVRPGLASPTPPPSMNFNPRTPRGVRQQTLPKSREFAWLNLLICTRGRRLSIQKQTRLCSIKLSFMLFGCEPAGEGVSSWTSHATKSKVRLEGRSA